MELTPLQDLAMKNLKKYLNSKYINAYLIYNLAYRHMLKYR